MNKTTAEQLEELRARVLKIEKKLAAVGGSEKKKLRRPPQVSPEPINRDPHNLNTR